MWITSRAVRAAAHYGEDYAEHDALIGPYTLWQVGRYPKRCNQSIFRPCAIKVPTDYHIALIAFQALIKLGSTKEDRIIGDQPIISCSLHRLLSQRYLKRHSHTTVNNVSFHNFVAVGSG